MEALPDLPEIDEAGTSFLENATLKAVHYSRAIPALTLADDSGLCVRALDGRPGLHSARYAPTTHERNDKLLAELAGLGGQVDRRASFCCAFANAQAGTLLWTVETELQGSIAETARGDYGFGYDPIFVVTDCGLTLAEMSSADKNAISARGQALRKLRDFLHLH